MILSVVFSFRNEAENIPELVKRVSASIKSKCEIGYELIFVNDDSTDDSLEILIEMQKKYPIKIINMSRRFGVTPCLLAGLANSSGDAVITMDADLQDPPELIPELLDKFMCGAEVVHTTRTKRLGEKKIKLWMTSQAYKIINAFSEIKFPKDTGDFKLLSKRVVKYIVESEERDPYMRGLSVWFGFNQFTNFFSCSCKDITITNVFVIIDNDEITSTKH